MKYVFLSLHKLLSQLFFSNFLQAKNVNLTFTLETENVVYMLLKKTNITKT